ncbi:MAG: CRTAC1 family protein [Pseudomonadota bacterium]
MSKLGTTLTLTSLLGLAAGAAQAQLAFSDVTASSGVEFEQIGDTQVPIGAGAAWVDVDGDGDDDLYATQMQGCNRLYLNLDNGRFIEYPDAAGASDCEGVAFAVGAADIDNDGDQDIFVGNKLQNRLYENRFAQTGVVRFVDVTDAAGLGDDGARTTGVITFGDYNGDSFLDVFVGNHVIPPETPENGYLPVTCTADYLWQNNGDGTFTDVGGITGVALSGNRRNAGCALAATFSDFDNDGDADLLVVNDFGNADGTDVPNRLFRNDGPGTESWTFSDVSDEFAYNYSQAGMGIAVADINHDGAFDYYSTDIGSNDLAVGNPIDHIFVNQARFLGVDANDKEIFGARGLVGWGTGFYDLDLDGWEDLIVVSGGVPLDKFPVTFGAEDYQHENPVYVYMNTHPDRFPEVHAEVGVTAEKLYRGSSFADYDNDGDMDMLISNFEGTNTLYRNDLDPKEGVNNWVKVRAQGTISNRDAIGTRIELTTDDGFRQMREIDGGSGYAGRNTLVAHFGTADQTVADVLKAKFPSGIEHELLSTPLNAELQFVEPTYTATFSGEEQRTLQAGEAVTLEVTYRNHAPESQTQELWVFRVSPSGAVSMVRAPREIALPPGGSFSFDFVLPTGVNTERGRHRIIARVGTFQGALEQQDHVDLIVEDPAR